MALSVVTFNIGGKGTRPDKKTTIDKFLSKNIPSLLFLQENPWRKKYINKHVPRIKENYEAVSHKHLDATVLYRKDVLKDEGYAELWELFQDAFSENTYLNFVTFKERASFSKLTERRTGTSFVAMSWHGEYIGLSEKEGKNKFNDLLLVVKEINSKTKLPVIVGGDFNITLDCVSDLIEDQDLEVYKYRSHNRTTLIDFFVVTHDVELSDVKAFGDYKFKKEAKTKSEPGADAKVLVFDHDPVQALIRFDLGQTSSENEASEYSSDDETDEFAYGFDKSLSI